MKGRDGALQYIAACCQRLLAELRHWQAKADAQWHGRVE